MKNYFESNLSDFKKTRADRNENFGDTPENSNQLPLIENEIRCLVGMVKANLLEIGDLLVQGKKILGHGKFKPWVKDLGFRYSTANNYMRLHLVCAGFPEAVENIPLSSLHQITSKKCPEKLSEFLIKNNKKLEKKKIPAKNMKRLIQQFKKKEIDLESPEIQSLLKYDAKLTRVNDYKVKINDSIASIEKLNKYVDDFVKKFEWPKLDDSQETYFSKKMDSKNTCLLENIKTKIENLDPRHKIVREIRPRLKSFIRSG